MVHHTSKDRLSCGISAKCCVISQTQGRGFAVRQAGWPRLFDGTVGSAVEDDK